MVTLVFYHYLDVYLRVLHTFFKRGDDASYFLLVGPYEIAYNAFLFDIILLRFIYTLQGSCSSSILLWMFFSILLAVWIVSRVWAL